MQCSQRNMAVDNRWHCLISTRTAVVS